MSQSPDERLDGLALELTELMRDVEALQDQASEITTLLKDLGHNLHNAIGTLDNVLLSDAVENAPQ